MKNIEKLDKIIIEDNLNLSQEEIYERAIDILREKVEKYRWESCELKATKPIITEINGYRRFEFDVFGKSYENIEISDNIDDSNVHQPPKAAALPEVDI